MTTRPDDDLPLGTGTGHADEPDAAERSDEEPALEANRTDVEDSPTGHS